MTDHLPFPTLAHAILSQPEPDSDLLVANVGALAVYFGNEVDLSDVASIEVDLEEDSDFTLTPRQLAAVTAGDATPVAHRVRVRTRDGVTGIDYASELIDHRGDTPTLPQSLAPVLRAIPGALRDAEGMRAYTADLAARAGLAALRAAMAPAVIDAPPTRAGFAVALTRATPDAAVVALDAFAAQVVAR